MDGITKSKSVCLNSQKSKIATVIGIQTTSTNKFKYDNHEIKSHDHNELIVGTPLMSHVVLTPQGAYRDSSMLSRGPITTP